MKNTLLLLVLVLIMTLKLRAQAYDGKIEYQKTLQPVALIELPYPADVTEDAIKDFMARKGLKGSSSKGFTVYRNTKLADTDTAQSDLYFKIDRKRKEKDVSIITLLPAIASQDILTRTTDSSRLQLIQPMVDQAKTFLNNLTPFIDAHNTDVQVKNQQDVLKKAQKKMNGLQSDQADLEKKIRNLLSDQDKNRIDIVKQTQEIQNTVQADDNVKNKAQKKMNSLLDDQDKIAKRLRNAQADLDQNKHDQESQQKEIDKEQQVLDAIKAKQKTVN